MKNPLTSAVIEPTTFRFVAQHLNHCATAVPVSLLYELKKSGKVFTGKFVGTGPTSYEKRIYRAALSQRLRNTALIVPQLLKEFPRVI